MEIEDKVALITGAASGLGRATARMLAERGAVVVAADVDEDGGRAVAEELGGHFVPLDVSDLDANRRAVEFCLDTAGGIDIAYLNAGIVSGCTLGGDFDVERYRRAMGVNLDGVVFGAHVVSEAMRAQGRGGSIVATASLAGLVGIPFDPIYSANKHAVVGLVRSLGPALAADGIHVNAVCPGFADTKIIEPIREAIEQNFDAPIIPAEEVAAVVVELIASEVSGECHFVQANRHGAFRFAKVPGPRPGAAH